jgi:hypothetical protein
VVAFLFGRLANLIGIHLKKTPTEKSKQTKEKLKSQINGF